MKFLGIDLGWISGASGLCCLEWRDRHLSIRCWDRKQEIDEILTWIETCTPSPQPALIAVDAPTLIPNPTGMRVADKLAHHYFGRYHAGCYPANRQRPFAARTLAFGLSLEQRGFAHAPTIEPQQPGRYQIEVFPHTAIVQLFALDRILKYKKGKLAQRQAELDRLRQYILKILPNLEPRLKLEAIASNSPLTADLTGLTGAALKAQEDQLDSLICAYGGAYWWYWGTRRNQVLGDATTGYLVVPHRHSIDP